MSLRVFHVIFIIVCVAFCLFMTFWGVREWMTVRNGTSLALGLVSGVAGIGLMVYGVKVFQKLRDIP
jgi:TRAP-type C4-dicarboxylate transport system permease small subunit